MSGTSCDGVASAIVRFRGSPPAVDFELLYHHVARYKPALREALLNVSHADAPGICQLNFRLGEELAVAALSAVRAAGMKIEDIDLIGSHGHTVCHFGRRETSAGLRRGSAAACRHTAGAAMFVGPPRPSTLQIGEPAVIAERTRLPVVANFRPRDIAAGGEGAPLVPFADWIFFRRANARRSGTRSLTIALNLGGIANITVLTPRLCDVIAFDTGPGNCLIDEAATLLSRGRLAFDSNGRLAARGKVDKQLLARLLRHPYFALEPPKSASRETFTLTALNLDTCSRGRNRSARTVRARSSNDLIATLTELTAQSVFESIKRFVLKGREITLLDAVVVGGGGTKNATLMRRLAELFEPVPVLTTDAFGVPAEAREAMAFALLAYCTWLNLPSNVPGATGACRTVVLGGVWR